MGGDIHVWEENIELCPEMATVEKEKDKRRISFWAKCRASPPNTFVHVSSGNSKALGSKSFKRDKMGARLSWAGDLYSAQDYTSSRVIAFRYTDHMTNTHYDLPPVPIDHVGRSIRSIHDEEAEKATQTHTCTATLGSEAEHSASQGKSHCES